VLEGGVPKIDSLEAAYAGSFPYSSLSVASASFSSLDVTAASNEKASHAVATSLDAISSISQDVQTLETFLHLHIPNMEDGGNFGVTVQLTLLKQMSDLQEAASKSMEDLSGYAGSRADALEKLKLPSASTSLTKTTSLTTTDGKKEEKTSESTEDKNTTNETGAAYASRVAGLVAVDTLYYVKAQRAFQSVLTLYLSVLDFMDKNKTKLEKPRGSHGSRPMGMY
jgi:hypothetical protein